MTDTTTLRVAANDLPQITGVSRVTPNIFFFLSVLCVTSILCPSNDRWILFLRAVELLCCQTSIKNASVTHIDALSDTFLYVWEHGYCCLLWIDPQSRCHKCTRARQSCTHPLLKMVLNKWGVYSCLVNLSGAQLFREITELFLKTITVNLRAFLFNIYRLSKSHWALVERCIRQENQIVFRDGQTECLFWSLQNF